MLRFCGSWKSWKSTNIGAVVVSDDGSTVSGIVSERDVVRHLHTDGVAVLEQPCR